MTAGGLGKYSVMGGERLTKRTRRVPDQKWSGFFFQDSFFDYHDALANQDKKQKCPSSKFRGRGSCRISPTFRRVGFIAPSPLVRFQRVNGMSILPDYHRQPIRLPLSSWRGQQPTSQSGA
jgi:hypothetical protein